MTQAASAVPALEPHCGSWIIVDRTTGKPVMETFYPSIARHINQDKFEVLTAQQWLARFNAQIKDQAVNKILPTGGYVNANGEPLNLGALADKYRRKPTPSERLKAVDDRSVAKESHGFRVVGHPPGAMEAAKSLAERAVSRWWAMTDEERLVRTVGGERAPAEWAEASWRSATKPTAVHSKPYAIESSAQLCAELARKQGWTDVEVVEILKG